MVGPLRQEQSEGSPESWFKVGSGFISKYGTLHYNPILSLRISLSNTHPSSSSRQQDAALQVFSG